MIIKNVNSNSILENILCFLSSQNRKFGNVLTYKTFLCNVLSILQMKNSIFSQKNPEKHISLQIYCLYLSIDPLSFIYDFPRRKHTANMTDFYQNCQYLDMLMLYGLCCCWQCFLFSSSLKRHLSYYTPGMVISIKF